MRSKRLPTLPDTPPHDRNTCRRWWEHAAERGDVAARKNLEILAQWQPRVVPIAFSIRAIIDAQEAAFAYGGRPP